MARVSRSKPKKQPARKQGGSARRSAAKKPTRKAPARQARKGKSAPRGAARGKRTSTRAPARPRRAARTEQVRRLVARPRPGQEHKPEEAAQHDHEDPRLAGVEGLGPEGDKVQAENYGQFKNKAVARFDKPVNWFRRAPKPKA